MRMRRKFTLFLLIAVIGYIQLSAQTLDPKFVSTDGAVNAIVQSGDSVYIGGNFFTLGLGARGLARFTPGSTKPDVSFPQLSPNSNIQAMEADGNGGFYLSGYFTAYNNNPIEPTAIIHILSNGSLDPSF